MKLWQTGTAEATDAQERSLAEAVELFTVGDDWQNDQKLLLWDCLASIAHARMLRKIGLLTVGELAALEGGLREIAALSAEGQFRIQRSDEDCHTAIENF